MSKVLEAVITNVDRQADLFDDSSALEGYSRFRTGNVTTYVTLLIPEKQINQEVLDRLRGGKVVLVL